MIEVDLTILYRKALVIGADHFESLAQAHRPNREDHGKFANACLEAWLVAAYASMNHGLPSEWPDPKIAMEEFNAVRKEVYGDDRH